MSEMEKIREAAAAIRGRCGEPPSLGLVLGSGLGGFCESLRNPVAIDFAEIPHFERASIPGHAGRLVVGEAGGTRVAALAGRVHCYEGHALPRVVFPVRVLGCLGIRRLVITNSAGGIHESFRPGDLMLIRDHINLMGANPLQGENLDELGPRFPDMSRAYDGAMQAAAVQAAAAEGLDLKSGVYIALAGPSYETPAEIRMCRALGADAVGMSTVPEVIAANHMGIRVLGLSCITNMAAGILPQRLSHEEVMKTTERTKGEIARFLATLIPMLGRQGETPAV
jgi:purine-nucleoside phosphorylase